MLKPTPNAPQRGFGTRGKHFTFFFFFFFLGFNPKAEVTPQLHNPSTPPTLSRFWGERGGIWRLILEGLVYLLCAEAGA